MTLLAGLLLIAAAGPLDEAEAALVSGRSQQSGKMIEQMASQGVKGPRFDRLRAGQALATGRDTDALALYGTLAWRDRKSVADREGAGIAAYRLGRRDDARGWVKQAMELPGATWRAFNLCGVLADESGDFAAADACYDRADAASPNRAEVANNRGWSLLLRGQWADAASAFERSLALDPTDRVARSNLDLAKDAVSAELPVRKAGESDADFGRRLNDAGVMAGAAGMRSRAIAAFASAVEVRPTWSAVTQRNLDDATRP